MTAARPQARRQIIAYPEKLRRLQMTDCAGYVPSSLRSRGAGGGVPVASSERIRLNRIASRAPDAACRVYPVTKADH